MNSGGVDQNELHNKLLEQVSDRDKEPMLQQVMAMGFPRESAEQALKETDYVLDKAIDKLLNPAPTAEFGHVEDPALATALHQSMEASGTNSQLRPATREYYDEDSWGVVPVATGSGAMSPTPPLPLTQQPLLTASRDDELDPLLFSQDNTSTLGPILSILHKIPLARRLLLNEDKPYNVEYFSDWWASSYDQPVNENPSTICQRLMGFLDGQYSSRAAADISQLESAIKPSNDILVDKLIQSMSVKLNSSLGPAFVSQGRNIDESASLDFVNLNCDATASLKETIYSMVDSMIWVSGSNVCMTHLADVITLTISRDDKIGGAGIELPDTWYPHRYSEKTTEYVKQTKQWIDKYSAKRQELNNAKFRTSFHLGKKVNDLLAVAEGHFGAESEVGSDLGRVRENLGKRLEGFGATSDDYQTKIAQLQEMFMSPEFAHFDEFFPDQERPEFKPYYLSGIVLSADQFCYREWSEDENLIDLDSTNEIDRWWYISKGDNPLKYEISFEQVQKLAKEGSSDCEGLPVTAIYANDEAWSAKHRVSVNEKLQQFLELDDKTVRPAKSALSSDDEEGPQSLPPDPNADSAMPDHDVQVGEVIDLEPEPVDLMSGSLKESEESSK